MAISIDSTTNLNTIDAAEATTGWTFSGITKTATSTASREGTNCIGGQVALNSFGYAWHTHGSAINMTTAGNERVYIWVNSVGAGTYAQSGWMVVIGDGTNRRAYRVGGSDVVPFAVKGWYCLMLDTANLPTTYQTIAGAAQPSLTAITQFGFGIYNTVAPSGNALNVFCDVVRYGSGLIVTSGATDDITLADIATDDFSSATGKAYGIIREIQPGVYGVQGDIIFGDGTGTNSIDWKETDSVVIFEDRVEGTGSNTKFQMSGAHNATGTFRAELGTAVSSGDSESGRSGVTFISANPASQPIDFNFSDTDIEDFFAYGCTWTNLRGGTIAFSSDATNGISHKLSGCTFSGCSQVDPGRSVVRNSTFAATGDAEAALLFGANTDVERCQFLGNTTGAAIEHATNITVGYDALTFSGNTNDILNSATLTAIDSYSESNYQLGFKMYAASFNALAQSFTGDGNDVDAATFYVKRNGSPTGNVTAYVYAHAGTFGTSSTPTGAALATSQPIDISSISTSLGLVSFTFQTPFTTVNTTKYVVAIEYTGGDSTNNIEVGMDASSPSHGGNYSYSTGSGWTADSAADMCFYVTTGTYLTINATDSNPTTREYSGATPSATEINNNVSVIFDNMKDNTEVRIYTTGTSIELDGIENATAGTTDNRSYTSTVIGAGTAVDYVLHNEDYENIRIVNFTWPSTATTINVQQRFDRNKI